MNSLPPPLGRGELVAWRLDRAAFAPTWDSGEGAYRVGGRWNGVGTRAVYCSLDPSTAILEVAVHSGFKALDTISYVMTAMTIMDPASVYAVHPSALPNANWLRPGTPSGGQQAFGDALLAEHRFVLLPSAVSVHSWNLIFRAETAAGLYSLRLQEPFALDPRLHPPVAAASSRVQD